MIFPFKTVDPPIFQQLDPLSQSLVLDSPVYITPNTCSGDKSVNTSCEIANTDINTGSIDEHHTSCSLPGFVTQDPQISQELSIPAQVPTRRSNRDNQPPIWLKDFTSLTQLDQNTSFPISKYLSYDELSPKYQAYLLDFSSVTEPTTYSEVVKVSQWFEAMKG